MWYILFRDEFLNVKKEIELTNRGFYVVKANPKAYEGTSRGEVC